MSEEAKPIVIVPPRTLKAASVKQLRNAGYVVVISESPELFTVIRPPPRPLPLAHLPVDNLGGIALSVLADEKVTDSWVRDVFRKRVFQAAIEAEKRAKMVIE
jgi:hypothetical protein